MLNRQRRSDSSGISDLLRRIGEPAREYEHSSLWEVIPQEVSGTIRIDRDPIACFGCAWFDAWFLDVDDVVPWLKFIYDVRGRSDISERRAEAKLNAHGQKSLPMLLLRGENGATVYAAWKSSADICAAVIGREARQALFHALSLQAALSRRFTVCRAAGAAHHAGRNRDDAKSGSDYRLI